MATKIASAAAKAATLAIQYALVASGSRVTADGIYGPRTAAAVQQSPSPSVRAIAIEHAAALSPQVTPGRLFVSQAILDEAVSSAMAVYGAAVGPFLRLMIRLENYPVRGGVETTQAGTFRGVAQFSRPTWDDVRSRLDSTIGTYDSNVTDAVVSARAAAAYYRNNESIFKRLAKAKGWVDTFTPELGYVYHQQGPGAGSHFLKTGVLVYPNQSGDSLAIMESARQTVV